MKNIENLKPCPLCGGEAELTRSASTDTPRVFCKVCRCNTGGYKTEEEAIAAWNKRHSPTEPDIPFPYNIFGAAYEVAKMNFCDPADKPE